MVGNEFIAAGEIGVNDGCVFDRFCLIESKLLCLYLDSQISTINSPQWRSTISTQTETLSLSKSYDDIKINGHPQRKISFYYINITNSLFFQRFLFFIHRYHIFFSYHR